VRCSPFASLFGSLLIIASADAQVPTNVASRLVPQVVVELKANVDIAALVASARARAATAGGLSQAWFKNAIALSQDQKVRCPHIHSKKTIYSAIDQRKLCLLSQDSVTQ
jgi:hypothetical protein